MTTHTHLQIQGRFKLIRRRADESIIEETPWMENRILDQGLDRFGLGLQIADWCKVGTNSTAPANNQTVLLGYVAVSNSIQAQNQFTQATAPYYGTQTRTYRFAVGAAAGTLAEVGVGWATGNATNTLWCRALILDANGNPTTITVLSDEVLDVTYELRLYPDMVDKVFTTTIGGILYDCLLRPSSVTDNTPWTYPFSGFTNATTVGTVYNGTLGSALIAPNGLSSSNTSALKGTYAPGTYTNTFTCTWGLSAGNLAGGITAVRLITTAGAYKMSFNPAIPKDNTNTLNLAMIFSWGRYVP